MQGMEIWNKVNKPPLTALKEIKGGRMSGKTDISPQWRYQVLTEVFGPCGVGWKYTVDKKWREEGSESQVMCFADISFYFKVGDVWSEAIPGSGGSMLIEKESKGLHTSDEGYKMAVTDALSVALKMIGVAAEIYLGNFDGSKYLNQPVDTEKKKEQSTGHLSPTQESLLKDLGDFCKGDESEMSLLLADVSKTEKNGEWVSLKLEQVRNVAYNTEAWGKVFGVTLGKLRARIKEETTPPNPYVTRIEAALQILHGDNAANKIMMAEAILGKKDWRILDEKNLETFAALLETRVQEKEKHPTE